MKETNSLTAKIRSVPLEKYRHARDGRKWKDFAFRRRLLFLEVSTYANGDGTFTHGARNYSPSMDSLQLGGWGRRSLYSLLNDLRDLGFISWARPNHYDRRVYFIDKDDLPAPTEDIDVSAADMSGTVNAAEEDDITFEPSMGQ